MLCRALLKENLGLLCLGTHLCSLVIDYFLSSPEDMFIDLERERERERKKHPLIAFGQGHGGLVFTFSFPFLVTVWFDM